MVIFIDIITNKNDHIYKNKDIYCNMSLNKYLSKLWTIYYFDKIMKFSLI